jgi:hypothetical protein
MEKSATWFSKALRGLHHAIFHASRDGRSSEIAAWSNAVASIGFGVVTYALTRSWPFTVCIPIIVYVLLRAALTHRLTVWIAAALGTLAVSGAGGGLSWLFAHVIEVSWVPALAAAIGALVSATFPAWAYARLARLRGRDVRDSLIEPVSVPPSR